MVNRRRSTLKAIGHVHSPTLLGVVKTGRRVSLVYVTLGHNRRTKSCIYTKYTAQDAKFSKSRVWEKVPLETTIIWEMP